MQESQDAEDALSASCSYASARCYLRRGCRGPENRTRSPALPQARPRQGEEQPVSKYISRGEMIGKKGKDLVSIPLPQIEIPQFRYGQKGSGGVGQGDGDAGPAARPRRRATARRGAGDQPGGHILEVELTMEEMAADPRRGAGPAAHRAARQEEHRHHPRQVHRHPPGRPGVAAPLQAHLQARPEAADRLAAPTTPTSPIVVPIREDKQYRSLEGSPASRRASPSSST